MDKLNIQNNYAAEWVEQRFEQKDLMPRFQPGDHHEIKTKILKILHTHEVANLATASPNGWPIAHAMHFVAVEGENLRPIFYMLTHKRTRKLVNIANSPRVSLSLYNLPGYENRKQAWFFQFLGVARAVDDPDELESVWSALLAKPGNDYIQNLPFKKQPCIRIDTLFGTWMDQSATPPMITIDYGPLA